ncbi:unnamed protein product [Hermetia illucens]|uniref:Uncharacterized protein n=1 Tax=Hermetia illucens TaxID=343691 RepID=A0A7R8UX19_HERIL|nr:unnamed protein product [Hermetia illucens]
MVSTASSSSPRYGPILSLGKNTPESPVQKSITINLDYSIPKDIKGDMTNLSPAWIAAQSKRKSEANESQSCHNFRTLLLLLGSETPQTLPET